jgi:glycosyltransferase involved in cell wall biosynthesis
MKISIITVCLNSESTIRETILSVLNQNYKNVEYIIIDGGSTDRTIEIIKSFSNQISFFVSEKDNGIYDAMNRGIRLATGEIVGIINSDDTYIDSNVISDVVAQFKFNSSIDILYGNLNYVDRNNNSKMIRVWKSTPYYYNYFEEGNVPPHPTLFLKSKVYTNEGYYLDSYKYAADYEFMLRVFKTNKYIISYYDRFLVSMKIGGASNASFKNIIKANKEVYNSWRINNYTIPYLFFPKKLFKRFYQFFLTK